MREILFRGKSLDNGEWVEGDLRRGGYFNNDSETYIMKSDYALHNIPVDPETVGQFTGLTDKNGVKIFEGDIVKSYHFSEAYGEGIVRWERDLTGFYYDDYKSMSPIETYEVIGNIFDNPELLKGETDVHM